MPSVSIIICTIRRYELYSSLIEDLLRQTHTELEILIVGRQGETAPEFPKHAAIPIRWMPAPKGLAPARNVGLSHAVGDYVVFLDDDVSVPQDFVGTAVEVLERPEYQRVGGLTGYDRKNYNAPVSPRWKLRKALGITPSLEPGDSDHLGRSVTLAFAAPFQGCRKVKWLPGFCQFFRRAAVEGLRYDEKIIVEDRDFSMKVGETWTLLMCGDLELEHHVDDEGRHAHAFQVWRAAFGLGRSFAKRKRSIGDVFSAVRVFFGELLIDLLILIRRPNRKNFDVTWLRMKGFLQGYLSWNEGERLANVRVPLQTDRAV